MPRWLLLIHGVRPTALRSREAYVTRSGDRFYWIEELNRRLIGYHGCEFIIGDLDGAWRRCGAPRVKLQYCRFHYQVCHMRAIPPDELLRYLLAVIPLKVKVGY